MILEEVASNAVGETAQVQGVTDSIFQADLGFEVVTVSIQSSLSEKEQWLHQYAIFRFRWSLSIWKAGKSLSE